MGYPPDFLCANVSFLICKKQIGNCYVSCTFLQPVLLIIKMEYDERLPDEMGLQESLNESIAL
jgi:hypothetical protein